MRQPSRQPSPSQPAARRWLLALSALYILVYLPAVAEIGTYHGDERFYTDGALGMLRTGTWTSVTSADGVPRFNKPLLTYWLVAGTFRVLGVSPIASRLASLLMGLMTAWLVWAVTRRLSDDDELALIAGTVSLAHVGLGELARRATPDIFLAGFVTLSLVGFLLLADGRGRAGAAWAAWAAWIGVGLGAATKGVQAVVAALFGLAAWAVAGPDRAPRRTLLAPMPVAAGLLVGLAGTGLPILEHGTRALQGLYDDQIAARGVQSSVHGIAANWLGYLWNTWVFCLPWSVLVLIAGTAAPRLVARALGTRRQPVAYALGWWVVLSVVLAAADFFRPRYMAPSYPLLALPIAVVLLGGGRSPTGAARLRGLARAAGLVVAGCGVVLAWVGAAIDARLVLAGVLWGIGGGVAVMTAVREAGLRATLVGFAAVTIVLLGTTDSYIRPTFAPAPEPATAMRLLSLGPAGMQAAGIALSENRAAKIRLAAGGRIPLPRLGASALTAPPQGRVFVVGPRAGDALRAQGFTLEPAGVWYEKIELSDAFALLTADDPKAWLAARRRHLFIAHPPT